MYRSAEQAKRDAAFPKLLGSVRPDRRGRKSAQGDES